MEATVTEVGNLRRQLTLTVSASEVSARRDELIARYSGRINVKGFRPGKTPKSIVLKRFGKEIKAEGSEALLREAFEKAMKDNGLKPIGPMQVDDDAQETDDGLKQVVSFDITPEIALPELKDVTVTIEEVAIDESEVDEEIDNLRRRSGKYADLTADDVVVKDDVVTLSGSITAGDEKVKDLQDLQHLIGGYPLLGQEPNDVVKLLDGKKVGDTVEFDTTLADNFQPEEWAGKEAKVSVAIQAARRMELAEVDEAFAQQFGAKDGDELKNRMKDMIVNRKQGELSEKQTNEMLDELLAKTSFDLPEKLLENAISSTKANAERNKPEGEEVDEAEVAQEGEKELRRYLIIEAAADQFEVKATRQDLDQQIFMAAYQSGRKPEEVAKQLQDSGRIPEVLSEIRNNKTVALLLEKVLEAHGVKPEPEAEAETAEA